jgi:hypothetical protein
LLRPAAAIAALLILGACNQQPAKSTGDDKFAGLDGQILSWRQEILKSDKLCQSQVEGQKCQAFEVRCKAERAITPEEQAKGMTAKVVAALNWNGFDQKFKQAQTGAATALFTRANGAWTRAEHPPVNLSTCADL